MSNVFAHQNYSNLANSDLENNSRLALHLALHLRETQQTPDGSWPAPHIGAMLRHTCHAIEALHLLKWRAYEETIRTGIGWLLNLSDWNDPYEDDQGSIKYHPSRFKTLAWLGHFFNENVLDDFAYLTQCINEDGLSFNIIDKQILGSIIYADCLALLDADKVAAEWRQKGDAALTTVMRALQQWCEQSTGEVGRGLITSLSDASYGLDLLLREAQITQNSPIVEHIYNQMCELIETPFGRGQLTSDLLYCAIQLANYFGEQARTQAALQHFFVHLRAYYDDLDPSANGRIAALHPLVLRALIAYGGKELCDQMLTRLLNREYEAIRQAQSMVEARREIFEALIRRKTRITIVDVEPLSGGITDARIFRVSYELGIESLLEQTANNHSKLAPPSIVVRSDTPEAIHQAVKQYKRLPSNVQHLFARHAGEPLIFEAKMEAPAFMILEDLTHHYDTFRHFFDDLDRTHITDTKRAALQRACRTLVQAMGQLYTETKKESKEFIGNQLSRLYFSAFDRYLVRLTNDNDLRRLKPFFDGFWLTEGVHFSSFEYYQSHLERHRDKLRVTCLMLVHGDLHARNVMLDECQTQLKLIDLDKLEEFGDYILDFAQLFEDIAMFRFLFDESNRRYLRTDQIEFSAAKTMVTYPALGTPATQLFQEWLLAELALFAQVHADQSWKERLWLGIALHLMSLINKAHGIHYATVLYVEAIRLLDELVQSLDSDLPLPERPFRGEHPSGGLPELVDPQQQQLVLPLHEAILALQTEIQQKISVDIKPSGKVIRYFIEKVDLPFAVLDGKKNPPKILLRNSVGTLNDPRDLVQATGGELFQRAITIDNPADIQYVADIVAQLMRQVISTNGHKATEIR